METGIFADSEGTATTIETTIGTTMIGSCCLPEQYLWRL